MHEMDRVANLLGATALAVTDMMVAGATRTAGVSASGAAALLALRDTAGVGVTDLGRRVGLSQSAAGPGAAVGSTLTRTRVATTVWVMLGAVITGWCATVALVAYLLATREQVMSVAVVLSALYPALPVLLGLTVLHERLCRVQVAGLLTAGVAVVLLTAG